MDDQYGRGQWKEEWREFQQIKKWGDRAFRDPVRDVVVPLPDDERDEIKIQQATSELRGRALRAYERDSRSDRRQRMQKTRRTSIEMTDKQLSRRSK
jgi:hypothetical protein